MLNSYKLETLAGDPIPGSFSARRLRGFSPKEGTKLAEQQKEIEEQYAKEEGRHDETILIDHPAQSQPDPKNNG